LSRKDPVRFMIMDACVLIDYMNGEPDLFRLISSYIGPIYVVTAILEEVDCIKSIAELEELGLFPIDVEVADVFLAAEMIGPTSFQDDLCLLTAKRQNLTCITNDKKLRVQCENSNVSILWGLELVLELAKLGGISRKRATQIAIKINVSNPRHISQKVLDGFIAKLSSLHNT